MRLKPTRRITRTVLALLALLLVAAAVDGTRLWRHHGWNQRIAAGSFTQADPPLPEFRFAKAAALASAQPASGADEAALNQFRALQGDSALGQAARYNSANLLLRQAQRLHAAGQQGLAVPVVELAKETYREVLRNDPGHWPTRYNLERAQRLLPDAEESDEPPPEVPRNAERAATTMRAYSPGLP